MNFRHLRRAALACAALVLAAAAAPAIAADAPKGAVILTVTGDLASPNRGAFDPDSDKFFGYQEDEFEAAAQFDYDALQKLDMVKVRADFPKDGPVREFEGPLLADVLKAAGAEGKTVTVKALDGYAVEAPLEDLVAKGAVVALRRDGRPFGIGDFGPTQIVFPRAEKPELKDMPDDNWVWSVYHIRVE